MSRYTCMQPPADVEPARVSHTEQSGSSIAVLRMSAARAMSREEKLILRMESITGRASYLVMSTCSTTSESSSAFLLVTAVSAVISANLFIRARGKRRRHHGLDGEGPIWAGDPRGQCMRGGYDSFFRRRGPRPSCLDRDIP